MIIKNLPHDFSNEEEKKMPVIFRTYRATQLAARNKSVIHENMIDIVLSGKKKIVNIGEVAYLESGDLNLLSKGNNLISEVLQQDALKTIEFRQLKLEELLLYLLHLDAAKFHSLLPVAATDEEMWLRNAAEHNISNPVTVEDLAFLCNMSISTFKRKFFNIYDASPVQWLLKQRLQLAASLLDNPAEKPGIVFEKVGYGNHSSFSQAFKKHFGITPTEYQEKKLNV